MPALDSIVSPLYCQCVWANGSHSEFSSSFRILVTSESTGLIETITDTMSVHSIKKTAYSKVGLTPGDVQQQQLSSYTLYDHFKEVRFTACRITEVHLYL